MATTYATSSDRLGSQGPDAELWYFAYGSNMQDRMLNDHRQVNYRDRRPALLEGYGLIFDVQGVPYSEPGMANIIRLERHQTAALGRPPTVHGLAFRITVRDFRKIFATEGAGLAYQSTWLTATDISGRMPSSFTVCTLVARRSSWRSLLPCTSLRQPSRRYLDCLIDGATKGSLPDSYITWLADQSCFDARRLSPVQQIAAKRFALIWLPIQQVVQRAIICFRNERGTMPAFFFPLFDVMLVAMWMMHDYVFAPIWGRGDGM